MIHDESRTVHDVILFKIVHAKPIVLMVATIAITRFAVVR